MCKSRTVSTVLFFLRTAYSPVQLLSYGIIANHYDYFACEIVCHT
jgi:hypothetical protein